MLETKHTADMKADTTAAQIALEKADTKEMFAIYERMVKRYGELETAFEVIVKHYTGTKDEPRGAVAHQPDVVASMERVALAAIDLARAVASPRASDAVDPVAANQQQPTTRDA